ncbi:MAG: SDR family oxidoreductase [Gammaproteobacteria bacterium]|nr:SDR family oxidoreductase [Gammaproteobacteria bacterium]MDE2345500.1 SDR family oxidoreductase [Gammaproteobacteria bacterium]
MPDRKIAVVTGANRGIGLEVARQLAHLGLQVVLTARNLQKGGDAMRELEKQKLPVEFRKLDVTSNDDAQALAQYLREQHGRVDVLVNNAGILPESSRDSGANASDALKVSPVTLMEIFNTNTLGAVRLIQALVPLMPEGARIVNVSSAMGALNDMGGGYLGYRISKAALNVVTRVNASELSARGILVNSVHPGWVRTAMGGPGASRSIEKGAETIVWLATSPDADETGHFWHDRKRIPW